MALTEIPVELSSTPGIADSSNATAITIDSSENTTFSVDSNVIVQGTHNEGGGLLFIKGTDTAAADKNLGSLCFGNPSDACLAMIRGVSTDTTAADLRFYTEAQGGAIEERMRIDSAARVSINAAGASSPAPLQHFQVIHHSGGGRRSTLYYNQDNKIALGALNASSTWEALAIEGASIDLKTGGTTNASALNVDADGYVTMPKQPAFLVTPSTAQNNISINANTTIAFGTEIFDQNGDFASNTFTAPVTGKYQFNINIRLNNVDSAADYYTIYLITSNRDYYALEDPGQYNGDIDYKTYNFSVLADLDASDTAYVRFYQSGGTAQTDTAYESGGTTFSGHLVA